MFGYFHGRASRVCVTGGGGGGAKDNVRARTLQAQSPKSLTGRAGSIMEAFGFLMLSRGIQWRIQGGGGAQQAPPKIGSTMCFLIKKKKKKKLKNKAQIARESINTTPVLPGPLSGLWTPAESEFGSTLVMCVLAHNLLRPPK